MNAFHGKWAEGITEAVCVLNAEGAIVWKNESFAVFFDVEHDSIVGENIFSILKSQLFGQGLTKQLALCASTHEKNDKTYYTKESHIPDFTATCTPIDTSGAIVLSMRQLEKKTTQYNWNHVIDSARAMLIVIDSDHHILDVNKSVLEYAKKTKGDILTKKCYEVIPQIFDSFYACHLKESLTSKTTVYVQRYDQVSERHFGVEISPVYDSDGEFVCFLSVIYDITSMKETEHMLVQSGANFQKIFQYSASPMLIINKHIRIANVNQAACRLLEYSEEELIGKQVLDITHPDDCANTKDLIGEISEKDKEIFQMKKRYITKTGRTVHGQISASKVTTENNKVFYIAQITDISSAMREKELLIAKANQFKTLFTDSKSMKLLIDPQTKQIIEANKSACHFYGYTHKEITQLTIDKINILSPDQLEKQINNALSKKRSFFKFKHKLNNGEIKNVEVHTGEIEYKSKRLLYSIIHDATAIEKTQQALVESEARYRKMIDNMRSGVAVYKPNAIFSDFEFVDFNKAAERITNSSGKQVVGSTLKQQFPNMGNTDLFKALVTCAKTGEDISLPPIFYKDEQREGWRKNYIYKLNADEIVAIFEDVTPEVIARENLIKAKNNAEEADKLKSAFLANVSHEIRTPMNGIMGFAQRLSHPDLPEHKRDMYTRIVIESSSQLLTILNDVLDISKIETGQVSISSHATKLNAMLDDLYAFHKINASQTRINLFVKKDLSDLEAIIQTDEAKLRQVLNNLINNALKFTPQGYVEFGYRRVNHNLVFYVKDTGIGIEANKQQVIFDRFSQVGGDKYEHNGTGLGLAICKSYVELLGGRITIQSAPGTGTTFKFELPYRLATETLPHRANINEQPLLKGIKQTEVPTVLIAEDEDINFILMQEELQDLDIELLHAKNGAEAVEMVKKHAQISLVLMDIKMPVMNGLQATLKIKALRPKLPIIAQSAYALPTEINEALSAGCDNFLTKPIENRKLVSTLFSYLTKI